MVIKEQKTIDSLCSMGYTRREAEFLYLVGTHSGVFTLGQFCAYAKIRFGAASTRFINRASLMGHVEVAVLRSGTKSPAIYQRSRSFDYVVGRESATSPRSRDDIRTRLMCLDYIIANSDREYLHTEEEKREYFLPYEDAMPSRTHKKVGSDGRTVKHLFTDNFPISSQGEMVEFVYVDQSSSSSFQRFAKAYRPLLALCRKPKLVFVTTSEESGKIAAITFRHVNAGIQISAEVAAEFSRRDSLEFMIGELTMDEAIVLRELRKSRFNYLYDAWRNNKSGPGITCEFETFVLPCGYDFLPVRIPSLHRLLLQLPALRMLNVNGQFGNSSG